jgi:hypothetical protein
MASIAVDASLKERLVAYLRDRGYQVDDYGDLGDLDVAAEVAEAVARVSTTGPAGLRHRPRHDHRRQQGPRGPRPATEHISRG